MKNTFEQLLHALNVPYTRRFVNELYETHPNRDNLLGLWQMCQTYGIQAHGVEVSEKVLDDLSVPCVLHVSGRFVVVDNTESDHADFYWDGNRTSLSYAKLQQIWDGMALTIESIDDAKEPDYAQHKKEAWIENALHLTFIGLIILGCIALLSFALCSRSVLSCIFSIVDVVGALFCCLLLQKQASVQSKVGDKICSLFHQKDCNRILESERAKIGNYSWSEIGMGYFLTHLLCSSVLPISIVPLAITSLCAIPFSIWSIYYQARVARQWCVLCVVVQVLLCINATATGIFFPKFSSQTYLQSFLQTAIVGSMSLAFAFIVHWTMQAIAAQTKLHDVTRKYLSLKANTEVFNCLLQKERHVEAAHSDSSIVFGNPEAAYKVTILSNPHCNPCAKLHRTVDKLLQTTGRNLSVQYIFCSFNEDLKESARFLIAIYQQKGLAEAQNIYARWFESGKLRAEDFFAVYSDVHTTTPNVTAEMERHEQWVKRNSYASTPTILINGHEMPSCYTLDDLLYLL